MEKFLKIKKLTNTAFSLSEILITVVILGIVAAIVVPNLINRQVENANRTKVKKAMASYEKAINYIIIENDIRTTEGIREFGQDDDCESAKKYFKTVQNGANDCIFRTADRVWWNITDLTNPIIILKDSQKDKEVNELLPLAKDFNDKTVFALVGRFDDLGTLRVNDNAYEQTYGISEYKKYVGKLWYFITQSSSVLTGFDRCNVEKAKTCIITIDGISTTYNRVTTTSDTIIDKKNNGGEICIYNRESKNNTCGYVSISKAGDYWITDIIGRPTSTEAKSKETCDSSTFSICRTNGDYYEASKLKCEKLGGRLATVAELKIAKQEGTFVNGGPGAWFWALEEQGGFTAYTLSRSNDNADNGSFKDQSSGLIICVGNE